MVAADYLAPVHTSDDPLHNYSQLVDPPMINWDELAFEDDMPQLEELANDLSMPPAYDGPNIYFYPSGGGMTANFWPVTTANASSQVLGYGDAGLTFLSGHNNVMMAPGVNRRTFLIHYIVYTSPVLFAPHAVMATTPTIAPPDGPAYTGPNTYPSSIVIADPVSAAPANFWSHVLGDGDAGHMFMPPLEQEGIGTGHLNAALLAPMNDHNDGYDDDDPFDLMNDID